MSSVIGDFLERVDFDSYEDFYKNFKITSDSMLWTNTKKSTLKK